MNIVIVEDDINMRKSLEISLSDYDDLNIKSYKNAKDALKNLNENIDLIITDINMPGIDGLEFVRQLNGKFNIILITGNATLSRAIEGLRLGVCDFLTKPFDIQDLYNAIIKTKDKPQNKQNFKKNQNFKMDFVAKSPALEKSLDLAKKAAISDASIILIGESGVGKELFANFIHKNSKRNQKSFIAINMAAIPENLIESELFGFEKGAFTDAQNQKKGLFEMANEGSLFLDEIGEMPISVQAKLLRALQEKEITRLGGTKSIKIDVRIICATNANLQDLIKNGKFRQDLYYRLNTLPILIPPLRQRKEEILTIAQYILEKTCEQYSLGFKKFNDLSKNTLLNYEYPGNIRELISIVQRAAILSDGEEITKNDLGV